MPEFVRRYGSLDAGSLEKAVGAGFLMLAQEQSADVADDHLFRTVAVGHGGGKSFRQELANTLVFPLAEPGAMRFMITVGRTRRSTIFLDHGNISKFHAFFRFDQLKGNFTICDSSSTNGTYVEHLRLAPNLNTDLRGGEYISFGHAFGGNFYTAATLSVYLKAVRSLF